MNKIISLNNFVTVIYITAYASPNRAVVLETKVPSTLLPKIPRENQCVKGYSHTTIDNAPKAKPEEKEDEAFNNVLAEIKKLGDDIDKPRTVEVGVKTFQKKPSLLAVVKQSTSLRKNKELADKIYKNFGVRAKDVSTAYFDRNNRGWAVPKNKKYSLLTGIEKLTGAEKMFLICTDDLRAESNGGKTALLTVSTDYKVLYRKGQPYYSVTV